jgi:uncharacterized protein
LDGVDVGIDYHEAHRFLKAAADQGASRAVVNLARMYRDGLGVQKDMELAIRLYESVANAEFLAQIALGRIYARGEGAIENESKALHCYSQAIGWADRIADCPELREARDFIAEHGKT